MPADPVKTVGKPVTLVDADGNFVGNAMQIAGSNAVIDDVAVTTTATTLTSLLTTAGGSVKTDRVAVELQNIGAGIVYVGPAGVTTTTGRKIAVDGDWTIPLDDASDVYLIGDAAATVIVTQV